MKRRNFIGSLFAIGSVRLDKLTPADIASTPPVSIGWNPVEPGNIADYPLPGIGGIARSAITSTGPEYLECMTLDQLRQVLNGRNIKVRI